MTQERQEKWEVTIERAIIAAHKSGDLAEAQRLVKYLAAQRKAGM